MSGTLWRAMLRYLLRYPWLFALSVLGIALGVGVVVSVDLANTSARRAFTLSAESITGSATHHIIGGSRGLPENLYKKLRLYAAIRDSAPMDVSNFCRKAVSPPRRPSKLIVQRESSDTAAFAFSSLGGDATPMRNRA